MALLAFFFFIIFVISIYGIFNNGVKILRLKNRKESIFMMIGSLVLMFSIISSSDKADNKQIQINDSEKITSVQSENQEQQKQPNNNVTTDEERTTSETSEDNAIVESEKDSSKNGEIAVATKATSDTPIEPQEKLKVHFIDVGQGASQLIIGSTGKTILIDSGNNDKEQLIVNYLKKQKIDKIDILIGTHPDADHIGGMDAVIRNFDIGQIYMPKRQSNTKTFEDVLLAIKSKGLKVNTAKSGLTLDWEQDTIVKMIAPINEYSEDNDWSAVIHLQYGDTSFLLTGDIENASEKDIISSGANIKADVLLVPHHGSKSSTSNQFLDKVSPKYAVIQVGKNNYGHPTDEVLKRLNDKGIKIYRNDLQGDIIFTSDGKNLSANVNSWAYTKPKVELVQKNQSNNSKANNSKTNNSKTNNSEKAKQPQEIVIYKNCKEVRAAGKAPLYKGDPGYSLKLDRDKDGIACE